MQNTLKNTIITKYGIFYLHEDETKQTEKRFWYATATNSPLMSGGLQTQNDILEFLKKL